MFKHLFAVHEGLLSASRLPPLSLPGQRMRTVELGLLIFLGAAAGALASLADFHLRIPGHAVLRAVFPMALGLSLVPRRFAGSVMGCSALGTVGCVAAAGWGGVGTGALTSLALMGPCLDVVLLGAKRGWQFYLGFPLAGLAANLAALAVRGGFKALLPVSASGRAVGEWWAQAAFTYPLCGLAAGLISALIWIQFRSQPAPAEQAAE